MLRRDSEHARWTTGFLLAVVAISGFYLALETTYVVRLPLVMDEFQGAYFVERLTDGLPYRDFRPYKTVLGYYVQKPFLALGNGSWGGLIATKIAMAAVNALMLGLVALRLRRHFRSTAVLAGLAMTAVMSTFLERSADLRVDMLTAWAGLWGLVFFLDRRYARAGLAVALSFCISQKGLYYVLASQAALWLVWLVWPERRAEGRRAVLRFSIASAAGLALYLCGWSLVSSPRTVIDQTFLSHGAIAISDLYDIQLRYWGQTLERNPLFYGLALVSLAMFDRRRRDRDPLWILVPYGATLIALCAWHKQPWPYFFVLLIPTVFVLVTAAIDRLLESPIIERGSGRLVATTVFVAFGIVWPLLRLPVNLARDSGVQRRTIAVAEAALSEDDTYLAGVDILYRDSQVADLRLQWLDRAGAERLRRAGTADIQAMIEEIDLHPPKLFIDSYRTQQLPEAFRIYLRDHYCHLGANVFQRCARLTADTPRFELAFAGEYRIESRSSAEVRLDGRGFRSGDRATLGAGEHTFSGPASRLTLILPVSVEIAEEDVAPRPFFPDVYDY